MKKFALTAVAALAIAAFTSCDEFTLPNPPAQSNTPEAMFNADDLQVSNLLTGAINLPAAEGKEIELLKFTVENLPADRKVKFLMQVSPTSDYATVAEVIPTTGEDDIVRIAPADFQEAYATAITRNPAATDVYVRYAAYITNNSGTENARVGGPDKWYFPAEKALTPLPYTYVIEDAYYLVGTFNNWETTTALPLLKSQEGNPYDEPDFYAPLQVSPEQAAAGYSIAVVPASSIAAGNLNGAFGASNAEQTYSGRMAQVEDARTQGVRIPDGGSYMFKIDIYTLDYTIDLAYDELYINAQGYYPQYNKMLRLFTNDYVNYDGVMRTSGSFRLACEPNVNGMFYGLPDGEEPVTNGLTTSGKLQSYANYASAKGLTVPKNGFYYLTANIKDLKWSAVQLENISLVGSFNGWNVNDAAATMKATNSHLVTYTIQNVTLDAGGEFKFCCNHSWDISFGGAMDNIVQNGGNLKVPEAGVYDIKLDFTTIPYSVTLTKK